MSLLVSAGCGGFGIPAALSAGSDITSGPTLTKETWNDSIVQTVAEEVTVAPPLRVMSFNMRVRTPFDLFNGWAFRRGLVSHAIGNFDADIVGTQEALMNQLDEVHADLPHYDVVAAGRDDGKENGETVGILYRADRFELVDSGHFWLSDTPDDVASRSWGNMFNRMVTWAHLRDLEHDAQQEIFVFNTHLDVFSRKARHESAHLLHRKIQQLAGDLPVIATGDFNASEGASTYQLLVQAEGDGRRYLRDAHRYVHPTPGEDDGTMHKFNGGTGGERIDWILACRQLTPVAAAIDHTHSGRRYPSDHFPVSAVLLYTGQPTLDPTITAEQEPTGGGA
ncbi:MAG: endonuclease/exonuclease/phosphatase family protein [Phycisphaeraceae bacterium]